MQQLGHTRSSHQRDHLLQTPDTFVRAPLPGMVNATAIIHTAPATGASFTQYTVEFDTDGSMQIGAAQTFCYVLQGELTSSNGATLTAHQFAYFPPNSPCELRAPPGARVAVIEKPFISTGQPAPNSFVGDERNIAPKRLLGDDALEVRTLIPTDAAFDFAVNTMTFQPGAALPLVEIHVMEHGLLMLEGGGIYRLNEHWYPVTAGDFIYMASYCPQWFGAIGKTPAKYLIYKDWNRHPLASA